MLARLRGRQWGKMDAEEYLYIRMEGLDGAAPWSLAEAAKQVKKKLRVSIGETTMSKWRSRQARLRREEEDYEALRETTLTRLGKYIEDGVDLADMIDVQILLMVAQVHNNGGAAEAIKYINALTSLKRAMTSERAQRQAVVEYEESVERLKEKIDVLTAELKSRGFDAATLDELNKRTVAEIDKVILGHQGKGIIKA